MTLYQIAARGCDESTEIELDLTPAEAEVVARVAVAINRASTYDCMPRLYIATPGANNSEGN